MSLTLENHRRYMFTTVMNLFDLTSQQLKRAAAIKDQIAVLTKELTEILGNSRTGPAIEKRRTMNASGRRKIAAAQRTRWAKTRKAKAGKPVTKSVVKKSKMSEAARARVSARMKKYLESEKGRKENREYKEVTAG